MHGVGRGCQRSAYSTYTIWTKGLRREPEITIFKRSPQLIPIWNNLWKLLSQAVRGPWPLESQFALDSCGPGHTSSKELPTKGRKDCAESTLPRGWWIGCRLMNSSSVRKHLLPVKALALSRRPLQLCQAEPRGVSNSCLPSKTTLRSVWQSRSMRPQGARRWSGACLHTFFPAICLLPSRNSKLSLPSPAVTIWPRLMIYPSYSSLTDGKESHGNFLQSTLVPRRLPNNFTKCGLLVKLLRKQALINIRGVLRTHS